MTLVARKKNPVGDFYETPAWATQKLLEKITLQGTVIDPCGGHGAIANLIEGCVCTDIAQGVDVFDYPSSCYDNVITNPPYKGAEDFVHASLRMARKKVYMLLKLSFLEGAKRYELFNTTPLKTVYVFCKRVTMFPYGEEAPKNSGTLAYAWFEWDKKYYGGAPTVKWLL